MSENVDYSVDCKTRARTAVLRGVMRLEHHAAQELVFSAISADLDATGVHSYTIDVSEVVFMNSSVFRALASVVLNAKRTARRLVIVGRRSVPWQARSLPSLSALHDGLEIRLAEASKGPAMRREQECWAIDAADGTTLRFKDSKGLGFLDLLLSQPGRDLHVLEIVGLDAAGDAGPLLDARAKGQYRERLADLHRELGEAEEFQDAPRVERVRDEIEAVTRQLAEAVGLGGRDRRGASDVERARINVQRCVKEALDRIGAADPALGRYLAATVKTGMFCSFKPL